MVKWYLIVLFVTSNSFTTHKQGTYESIADCFDARDSVFVANEVYTPQERFKAGLQAVCVGVEE